MKREIEDDVCNILANMTFDGQVAVINSGQLERKTYLRVNKVLESLGGKWNRKAKGHVFEGNPQELIGDAVATGEYVNQKQDYQFFETPELLADEIVAYAIAGSDSFRRVLEPSAGGGRIVRAIKRAAPEATVYAVEINPAMFGDLSRCADVACSGDFLEIDCNFVAAGFDAVVMNPPFTRSQDIAHVRHAYSFVKPGGCVVSIMGTGWTFRQDRKAVEFRDWLDTVESELWDNDKGAFKESGTMVNTVTLRIIR